MALEANDKYCAICGRPGRSEFKRFGEWACSEAHVEEYVKGVRAQKQRQAVGEESGAGEQPQHYLGCCG
jgi:hypothetical protein